jgi:CRISPR/Cas system-associated protein Cas7 (RAMP superfamily)
MDDYKNLSDTELDEKLKDLGFKCAFTMVIQTKRGRCLDEKEEQIAMSLRKELEAVKAEIASRVN